VATHTHTHTFSYSQAGISCLYREPAVRFQRLYTRKREKENGSRKISPVKMHIRWDQTADRPMSFF